MIRLPWALTSYSGEPAPLSMGVSAAEANDKFDRYYDALGALGFDFVEVDEDRVVADPHHRWGFAPFHYAQSVYEELMQQILAKPSLS